MRLHAAPIFLFLLANVLAAPSRPRVIPNAEAELHLPATREDSGGGGILQSILQTLNPFSSRKSRDLDDYLTSFKKRLVREASDLTNLYVRAAADVYPERGGRERRQPQHDPEQDFRLNHRPKREHPLEWPLFEDAEGECLIYCSVDFVFRLRGDQRVTRGAGGGRGHPRAPLKPGG
ncbi:uncharacterized protein LOC119590422 [Penaeus monodon]|uniref:uncharacterized protein LOC119590422 n=1 Tax=Penaeus monodon TaxID=6687 RepID=UPI0018A7DF7D|nr:uncharacterized protein LOC119590422 [Penaeus monodon]